jgi:hypothetical protein
MNQGRAKKGKRGYEGNDGASTFFDRIKGEKAGSLSR